MQAAEDLIIETRV